MTATTNTEQTMNAGAGASSMNETAFPSVYSHGQPLNRKLVSLLHVLIDSSSARSYAYYKISYVKIRAYC